MTPHSPNASVGADETSEVVNEQTREVKAWSIQLVQRTHGPRESDASLLDLIVVEPTGARRVLAKDLIGPILLFDRDRKIISCEANDTLKGDHPIVVDLEGDQISAPKPVGSNAPYNLVRIMNTNGQIVSETKLSEAGTIEVRSANRTYQVRVPQPQPPG